MWTFQEEFSNLEICGFKQFRNLTLFALSRKNTGSTPLDYLLLEDGIAAGKVRVTEIHAGGSVPELRLTNDADLPVLLVDGEELVGAKQNRVLNLTILAPAKQTCIIPVSCVESGRWSMATEELATVNHLMYPKVRGERVAYVTTAMRSSGSRVSDQAAVWRNIQEKAARLDATSPTGAMSAIYGRHATSVEEYVRAFQCEHGQQGAAFAIHGQVLGMDIFDHPDVMRRFFLKLVRSYALDALDAPNSEHKPISISEMNGFLTKVADTQVFSEQAIGIGKDVRVHGSGISGAALWARERYVHICAFASAAQNYEGESFKTRVSRPSHRRMF